MCMVRARLGQGMPVCGEGFMEDMLLFFCSGGGGGGTPGGSWGGRVRRWGGMSQVLP